LDDDNAKRIRIAEKYNAALSALDLKLPPDGGVYHQYVIRHPKREALKQLLEDGGIGTSILYPVPVHLQPAYADDPPRQLPVTEQFARELLCLPMYPELTDEEVEKVSDAVTVSVGKLAS
jgi:dTDP-4-amino-4,6-dideoxygalactose transaminase